MDVANDFNVINIVEVEQAVINILVNVPHAIKKYYIATATIARAELAIIIRYFDNIPFKNLLTVLVGQPCVLSNGRW